MMLDRVHAALVAYNPPVRVDKGLLNIYEYKIKFKQDHPNIEQYLYILVHHKTIKQYSLVLCLLPSR